MFHFVLLYNCHAWCPNVPLVDSIGPGGAVAWADSGLETYSDRKDNHVVLLDGYNVALYRL